MSASGPTQGPLFVGLYRPSDRFLAVREHIAVMKPTGELVAVTGSNDNDETPSSLADAKLFCAAGDLLKALVKLQAIVQQLNRDDFSENVYSSGPVLLEAAAAIAKAGGAP